MYDVRNDIIVYKNNETIQLNCRKIRRILTFPSLYSPHLTSPHLLQSAATLNVSDPADVITNATYQKVCQCSANYTALTAAAAKYSVGDVDTSGSSVQVADSIFNTTKEAAQPFLDFLQGTGKNLHAPTAGRCRFTV